MLHNVLYCGKINKVIIPFFGDNPFIYSINYEKVDLCFVTIVVQN